jgi:small subunit ribosomal protein S21
MSVNVRVELKSHYGISRSELDRDISNLIKRFKRACSDAGIVTAIKERQYYEKPSQKRNRKKRQLELQKKYQQMSDPNKYQNIKRQQVKD